MTDCEEIQMALMAVFDGEETEFEPEELSGHLKTCAKCRAEIERVQATFAALQKHERLLMQADLWTEIEPRLGSGTSLKPFVLVGALLVGWKLAEMLPDEDFGFLFKIVPVVIAVGLFAFLRVNPFRIDTELVLEK